MHHQGHIFHKKIKLCTKITSAYYCWSQPVWIYDWAPPSNQNLEGTEAQNSLYPPVASVSFPRFPGRLDPPLVRERLQNPPEPGSILTIVPLLPVQEELFFLPKRPCTEDAVKARVRLEGCAVWAGTCRALGGFSWLAGSRPGSFIFCERFHTILTMKAELPFQFRKCMYFLVGGTGLLQQFPSLRTLLPGRSSMLSQFFWSCLAPGGELLLQPALNFLSMNIK